MPTKRIKYKIPIQFTPGASSVLQVNDPAEPEEPEHFKYGIYFNDGYDYMKHLVSLEDFIDESKDIQELTNREDKKSSIPPPAPTRKVVVVNEFEVNNENVDLKAMEKIRIIAHDNVDEDILNALDSDAEYSDLEDNFIDIADGSEENFGKLPVSGDQELFDRFLGNHDNRSDEMDNENNDSYSNFVSNFRDPINEISDNLYFENLNPSQRLRLPSDDESVMTNQASLALLHAMDRDQKISEKKVETDVKHELKHFFSLYSKAETEYDEEDVEKAVDEWVNGGAEENRRKILEMKKPRVPIKKPENRPIIMQVRKGKTKKRKNIDSISMDIDNVAEPEPEPEPEPQNVVTDVSEFHVPRHGETADEKRERKRLIKEAKRTRREEKKEHRKMLS